MPALNRNEKAKCEDCGKGTVEPMRLDLARVACEELFLVRNVVIVHTTIKK